MNRIITQIYEIQHPREAERLIDLGVDHIGSVLVSGEAWKQTKIRETIDLVAASGSKSSLIPLFNRQDTVFRTLDYYGPDIIHFCDMLTSEDGTEWVHDDQLHLQEEIKSAYPEIKIMRSIPVPPAGSGDAAQVIELARIFQPVSDYFLSDTLLPGDLPAGGPVHSGEGDPAAEQPVNGFIGITGRTCDWEIVSNLVDFCDIPVILAGGLTPDNVFDGIVKVRPAGVDTCTGTNARDDTGRVKRFEKDIQQVERFIKEVRRAENQNAATGG